MDAEERKQNEAEARRRQSVDQTNLGDLHDFDIGLDIDISCMLAQERVVVRCLCKDL